MISESRPQIGMTIRILRTRRPLLLRSCAIFVQLRFAAGLVCRR